MEEVKLENLSEDTGSSVETLKKRIGDLEDALSSINPRNLAGIKESVLRELASTNSFGDGSDGDVTITSGTTTLTRDMFYNNLVINSGAILVTASFRVFVKGTLTNNGIIKNNGNAGGNGGTGVTSTQGAGGSAGAAIAS